MEETSTRAETNRLRQTRPSQLRDYPPYYCASLEQADDSPTGKEIFSKFIQFSQSSRAFRIKLVVGFFVKMFMFLFLSISNIF